MMMKDMCKKQSAPLHQEQSQYLGHCRGSEPFVSIPLLSSESMPGCPRRLSGKRWLITDILWWWLSLKGGWQQDGAIAGMLFFTCLSNCINCTDFSFFLTRSLLDIPDRVVFLKSILIGPPGSKPIKQTSLGDQYINSAWCLGVERVLWNEESAQEQKRKYWIVAQRQVSGLCWREPSWCLSCWPWNEESLGSC